MSSTPRQPKLVAILGPTASGKTSLAIKIAKTFGGEIVSADSRQVYRGMDLGAGKATKREMRGIPHYLIDVASPKRTFTVAQYQKLGNAAIKKILAKGKIPFVVGGTGLYLDTLLHGYRLPLIKPNPPLRKKLGKESAEKLFLKLKKLDPRRAATIDPHNKRRLVRALEIVLTTKKPVPELRKESHYAILKIGLRPSGEALKRKIHARLFTRLRQGMIREVRRLHEKAGVSWHRLDNFGLEYRFVSRYLRGLLSKEEMGEAIENESVRYAKRQLTWFKKDKNIHWIEKVQEAERLVEDFLETR